MTGVFSDLGPRVGTWASPYLWVPSGGRKAVHNLSPDPVSFYTEWPWGLKKVRHVCHNFLKLKMALVGSGCLKSLNKISRLNQLETSNRNVDCFYLGFGPGAKNIAEISQKLASVLFCLTIGKFHEYFKKISNKLFFL